jgi:hypothetical protein
VAKVYVVTAGVYSDYHIQKIFDNKPAAEEYVRQCELSDDYFSTTATIEEYDLESECTPPEKEPIKVVSLYLNKNGNFNDDVSWVDYDPTDEDHKEIWDNGLCRFSKNGLQEMIIEVKQCEKTKVFEQRARKAIIDAWYAWQYRKRAGLR